jgi:hypothetical protein
VLGIAAGAEGELTEATYWWDRAERFLSDPEHAVDSPERVQAIMHELNLARAELVIIEDYDAGRARQEST